MNAVFKLARRRGFACAATLLIAVTCGTPALAQNDAMEDPAKLVASATTYLQNALGARANELGGSLRVTVRAPDPRQRLAACSALEAYLPTGMRLTGRTLIGVRCLGPLAWQTFLPADVHLEVPVWASARPLMAGHVLAAEDLTVRMAGITTEGQDSHLVPANDTRLIGQALAHPLGTDALIRDEDLRDQSHLNPGDSVAVVYSGEGFNVASEGRAVGGASPGQSVQVRMQSGVTVTGTLQDNRVVELHM